MPLPKRPATPQLPSPDLLATLTAAERAVLKLVAAGHTDNEIAAILNRKTQTVRFHGWRVRSKLGVKNRALMVRYACATGLADGFPELVPTAWKAARPVAPS